MERQEVFDETDIKTRFIDCLRKDGTNGVIGVEVPCLLGDRRVDVLRLCDGAFYAYEIKSDKDNLKKLLEQIDEHSSIFDYVSVIVTPRHYSYIKKSRTKLPNKIGLIVFDNSDFTELKKPKINRRLKKEKLCYFLNRAALNSFTKKNNDIIELSDLRRFVSEKISTEVIKQSAYSALIKKYEERYNVFLSSLSEVTVPDSDDLKILSNSRSLTF